MPDPLGCPIVAGKLTSLPAGGASEICHKQTFNPETSTLSPIHSLIGFARSNTAALLACCGVEMMQLHTSM
jgi:NADH:ubiquinone oxidoreductase subunit B-like Fe-S oxidoreductase